MAITTSCIKLKHIILITIFFLKSTLIIPTKSQQFSKTIPKNEIGCPGAEKATHLHFYFHDTSSGRNATSFRIAQAASSNTSLTGFGNLLMTDDPLTQEPAIDSRIVGRAQGMYGYADQTNFGLVIVFNFVFMTEKFNGSTLSVFGRTVPLSTKNEMPIVGGSGLFRWARGYVHTKTRELNIKLSKAVVEYDVYVSHC